VTRRVAIIGNCQAQMLEAMFTVFASDVQVARLTPNFQMGDADRDAVLATLAQADSIFAQRVAGAFHLPWLTPASLKRTFGNKVWIWPNIYFDGYTPGVHYIYLNDWGKLSSPLEDYHLKEVVDAYRAGANANGATHRLIAGASGATDSFAASLDELRQRECETDVTISDWLATAVGQRRCFYTPNHPYNGTLAEMARRLAVAASIAFNAARAAEAFTTRLDRIYIPSFPAVVRRHALQFDRILLFRGVEVTAVAPGKITLGAPRCYDPITLVDQFYRIYDVALKNEVAA
jgi:hypothetical protein